MIMSLKYYKSNPNISNSGDIGEISLIDGDFIFSAYVVREINSDYHLQFSIADNTFSISTKLYDGYTANENSFISPILDKVEGRHEYFGEVFEIKMVNEKYRLYKKVTLEDSANENWLDYYIKDNEVFAYNDSNKKYNLINENNNFYIARNHDFKPLQIKTNNNLTLLYDTDNFFNNTGSHWFRIVVSNQGGLITFWIKNNGEENYKKIKTFSFTKRFSKGDVKLAIAESMELSQLSVSFLKANV
ncbi:MAG: hypothetical protein IKU15_00980 [Clostridia bacterium]|nr:hypothetical protein [Clostridia bacterium]